MGNRTLIGWCDSTVNPTTGCDGCELWSILETMTEGPRRELARHCYAGVLHEGRLALAMPNLYAPQFTEVRLAPGRMAQAASWSDLTGKPRPDKPWLDGMPRLIFVGDMGDIFSKAVPFDYLKTELIDVAISPKGRRHVWQILTKQARRMAEFSAWLVSQGIAWPENVWAGVSVTSPQTKRRIDGLHRTDAPVKFVSFEPLLASVGVVASIEARRFDWTIIGGESDQGSHKGRPFDVQWARDLISQCNAAGVAAYVKQLGATPYDSNHRISIDGPDSHAIELSLNDRAGEDWDEWPRDLRVREMPQTAEAPR